MLRMLGALLLYMFIIEPILLRRLGAWAGLARNTWQMSFVRTVTILALLHCMVSPYTKPQLTVNLILLFIMDLFFSRMSPNRQ